MFHSSDGVFAGLHNAPRTTCETEVSPAEAPSFPYLQCLHLSALQGFHPELYFLGEVQRSDWACGCA